MEDLQWANYKKHIRGHILRLFILATIWGIFSVFIGDGKIMLIVNIFFFLLTIYVAVQLKISLSYITNNFFAFIVSMLLWLLFNVLYRSIY